MKKVLVLIGVGLISSGAHAKIASYHDKNVEWNQKWERALPSNQVEGVQLRSWRSLSDLTDSQKSQSALASTLDTETHLLREDQSSKTSPHRLSWFSGWFAKAPESQPQKKKRRTLSDIGAPAIQKAEYEIPQTLEAVLRVCKEKFQDVNSSFQDLQENLYVQWRDFKRPIDQLKDMINQGSETLHSTQKAADIKEQRKHAEGLSALLSNVTRAAAGLQKQFATVPKQLYLTYQDNPHEGSHPQKSSLISTVQNMFSKSLSQFNFRSLFKPFLLG